LRLFFLQDYLYSPITQLFLKYFNDLCHKTYFNRNFGAVALMFLLHLPLYRLYLFSSLGANVVIIHK
ncbi:hypothetical protein NBH15_28980, partial [Parabacteroides sp. W1-Q-101]|uniref:hypothetical protein n=1 Tax=Parabacteroides caeci TaxID=2949650 RepID=UPI00202DFDCF